MVPEVTKHLAIPLAGVIQNYSTRKTDTNCSPEPVGRCSINGLLDRRLLKDLENPNFFSFPMHKYQEFC